MQQEEKVRAAIETLLAALHSRCSCPGEGHIVSCVMGGMLAKSALMALVWVVGDDDYFELMLNDLRERQARQREEDAMEEEMRRCPECGKTGDQQVEGGN